MTRILAVADEVDEKLEGDKLPALRPDVVLSCGDLPFDYLEYLVSRLDVPLLYVPGNHDPSLKPADPTWAPLQADAPVPGPRGCENIDGRVVEAAGLRVAGLGGSVRYRRGANQYTQGEMRRRALNLELRMRLSGVRHRDRRLDILVTHAPPFGIASAQDAAHSGFVAFERVIRSFGPLLAVYGHVHPYWRSQTERTIGPTRIINAVPSRLIEV
ncbi:MAG: metallophosphoesterase [Candidatus Dormiibacterota bacterium]